MQMKASHPTRWYVISLRPQGQHAALRRAAARHDARVLALSPWRLQLRDDPDTRLALQDALRAQRVVFTSPAAVRSALALADLQRQPDQHWFATGSATARALRRAGIQAVQSPARMDSEGLLELPGLAELDAVTVGLVTAPDGRDLLAPELRERGARLLRADVYARVPVPLSPAVLQRLRGLQGPACIALSSGGALQQVIARVPADVLQRLRRLPVAAASARLQRSAQAAGFADVELADGPRPQQLLAVMSRRFR